MNEVLRREPFTSLTATALNYADGYSVYQFSGIGLVHHEFADTIVEIKDLLGYDGPCCNERAYPKQWVFRGDPIKIAAAVERAFGNHGCELRWRTSQIGANWPRALLS